jgi:antitoxin HicB
MQSLHGHDLDAEVRRIVALPYRRELTPNADGSWFGRIAEFQGCMTEADTAAATMTSLGEAMEHWVRAELEAGNPVPAPSKETEYSGKFLVRVARWMHRALVERAQAEGVSLNQFVASSLSYALGMRADAGRNRAAANAGQRRRDLVAADRRFTSTTVEKAAEHVLPFGLVAANAGELLNVVALCHACHNAAIHTGLNVENDAVRLVTMLDPKTFQPGLPGKKTAFVKAALDHIVDISKP